MKNITELAKVLTTITAEQWEAIMSIPSGTNTFPREEKTQSSLMKQGEDKLPEERTESELYIKVLNVLKLIGIPPQILGYKYLNEAVMMVYHNEEYAHCITKTVYPDIAKKFKSTSSRVERAIRHAIQTAFDRGDIEVHMNIFKGVYSPLKGVPTNSEAIVTIAEYIRYN